MYGPPLPALFNNWLWYSQICNQLSLYGQRKSDHKRTSDAIFNINRSRLSVKLSNSWLVGLGLLGLTPFSTIFQLYRVIFSCKNYSFWGLLFSIFLVCKASFIQNCTHFIFSWTMNATSFSPFLKFVHIFWITLIIWKWIHLNLQ